MENKQSIIIGVAGGSGSGKTSVTHSIARRFAAEEILILEQDYYYQDQSHLPFEERLQTNYDHPDAFDNELLIQHIEDLLAHKSIARPIYDYEHHTRSSQVHIVQPKSVILLEGILILQDPRLVALMDIKLFIDTDADLRIIRRLLRDIQERGRSLDSVVDQYIKTVKPMHEQYVEPSKHNADMIIPEGGENLVAIDVIATKIATILAANDKATHFSKEYNKLN